MLQKWAPESLLWRGFSALGEYRRDAGTALLGILLEELTVSSAAKVAATLTGASRNALYTRALALKKDEE